MKLIIRLILFGALSSTLVWAFYTTNEIKKVEPMKICEVVIPAAGLGTRFLPFTKSVPKEMLPLLNKPAVQYIVEEAIGSGIDHIVMITAEGKEALENFLKPSERVEKALTKNNKISLLDGLPELITKSHFSYINQPEALGLGHAINLARNSITGDYFGIMLPDDIMLGNQPELLRLIEACKQNNGSIIAVQEVPNERISAYGTVGIKQYISPGLFQISSFVEKPKPEDAPSNYAIIGRYVLSKEIFNALDQIKPSVGGEYQLTDAMDMLLKQGHPMYALVVSGTRHDTGNPLGWLLANLDLALENPTYKQVITEFVQSHK